MFGGWLSFESSFAISRDGGTGETRMRMEDERRESQSGWPRRSRLGTSRLLGRSRRAHVWRRFVPIISFDDALVLYALLTLFGRHGEAAWRGQDDTGRTRAAPERRGQRSDFALPLPKFSGVHCGPLGGRKK